MTATFKNSKSYIRSLVVVTIFVVLLSIINYGKFYNVLFSMRQEEDNKNNQIMNKTNDEHRRHDDNASSRQEKDSSTQDQNSNMLLHNNTTTTLSPPTQQGNNNSNKNDVVQLDFAVVGFPKCGTSSLMNLFQRHNQTTMFPVEKCYPRGTDEEMKKLFQDLGELPIKSNSSTIPRTLRGFKCPTSIVHIDGLDKMKDYKNDTKLIVGIRHPVRWFESYYNFRVSGFLRGKFREKPPHPSSLIGRANAYVGLNTDMGRFELSLMQLGKTELDTSDLLALAERRRRVIQSPFPVLIYALEQLEDGSDQEEAFRKDLQRYLQVRNPFQKIPRSNAAGDKQALYNNTIYEPMDICEEQYANVRKELVTNGKATANWILNHFVKHPDVMIGGNDDVFRKLVQGFTTDPCLL